MTRAQVALRQDGVRGRGPTATTDGGGKFVFSDIQPGTYRVTVSRDGYVDAEYGQTRLGGPGTLLTLRSGETRRDIVLEMAPTGVISGRVYDRYGEPVVRANVEALQFSYSDGARSMSIVGKAQTNDRGEYRLYWLDPGKYFVSVTPEVQSFNDGELKLQLVERGNVSFQTLETTIISGGVQGIGGAFIGQNFPEGFREDIEALVGGLNNEPAADSGERFIPVYYPGTTDPTFATAIDLEPGLDFGGVALLAVEIQTVQVRGEVLGSAGEPPPRGVTVRLVPRQQILVGTQQLPIATVRPDGRFAFSGIVPGSYDLVATLSGRGRMSFATRSTGNNQEAPQIWINDLAQNTSLFARVPLEVGNSDVDNVTPALEPGTTLQGILSVETTGGTGDQINLTNLRLQLNTGIDGGKVLFSTSLRPAQVAEDGTFQVDGLPPRGYGVAIIGLPATAYLREARLDGVDVPSTRACL